MTGMLSEEHQSGSRHAGSISRWRPDTGSTPIGKARVGAISSFRIVGTVRSSTTSTAARRSASGRTAALRGRSGTRTACATRPSRTSQSSITEGELDALAAIQAGYPRTVSVPDGAGSNLDFVGEMWPLLKDARQVILAGDGDEPGQKLNGELARRFGAARCAWVAYPEGTKDLNDILRLNGEKAVSDAIRGAKPYPIKGLYKLSDYPDVGDPVVYETGFICLNPHLKLWRGEFIVITGVPSHGKSRFALELLCSHGPDPQAAGGDRLVRDAHHALRARRRCASTTPASGPRI